MQPEHIRTFFATFKPLPLVILFKKLTFKVKQTLLHFFKEVTDCVCLSSLCRELRGVWVRQHFRSAVFLWPEDQAASNRSNPFPLSWSKGQTETGPPLRWRLKLHFCSELLRKWQIFFCFFLMNGAFFIDCGFSLSSVTDEFRVILSRLDLMFRTCEQCYFFSSSLRGLYHAILTFWAFECL